MKVVPRAPRTLVALFALLSLQACNVDVLDPMDSNITIDRLTPRDLEIGESVEVTALGSDFHADMIVELAGEAIDFVLENDGQLRFTIAPSRPGPYALRIQDATSQVDYPRALHVRQTPDYSHSVAVRDQRITSQLSGDVDGDGSPDIVVQINDDQLAVYQQRGIGQFKQTQQILPFDSDLATDRRIERFMVIDLNADGYEDLVITGNENTVEVRFANNQGRFGPPQLLAGGNNGAAAPQWDEGRRMLVLFDYSGRISLYKLVGDNQLALQREWSHDFDMSIFLVAARVTDWNRDGADDVFMPTSDGIMVLAGPEGQPQLFSDHAATIAAIYDVDRDGDDEIITESAGWISIWNAEINEPTQLASPCRDLFDSRPDAFAFPTQNRQTAGQDAPLTYLVQCTPQSSLRIEVDSDGGSSVSSLSNQVFRHGQPLLADLDTDGRPDIATAADTGLAVTYYRDSTLHDYPSLATDGELVPLSVNDTTLGLVSADGNCVKLVSFDTPNRIDGQEVDFAGLPVPEETQEPWYYSHSRTFFCDIDGDSHQDIIRIRGSKIDSDAWVREAIISRGTDDGDYDAATIAGRFPTSGINTKFSVADFNSDGSCDVLLVGNRPTSNSYHSAILEHDPATRSFTVHSANLPLPDYGTPRASKNLSGIMRDGQTHFLVPTTDGHIGGLSYRGNGVFEASDITEAPVPGSAFYIAGTQSEATLLFTHNRIELTSGVLRNDGSFEEVSRIDLDAKILQLRDIDRDGIADLLARHQGTLLDPSTLYFVSMATTGRLRPPQLIEKPDFHYRAKWTMVDTDKDGDLDIVGQTRSESTDPNRLVILRNLREPLQINTIP